MNETVHREFLEDFDESCFPLEFLRDYELIECLGHNELTETFLITRRDTGEYYVAKCYDKDIPFPQVTEDELLRNIAREGLPHYTGKYEGEKKLCIVREYIEGESLDQLFTEERFTPEKIIEIGKELCEHLIYLHGHKPPIIHRDIKPQNIIRNTEGKFCLIDFGNSRFYRKDALYDTVCCGTMGFAAPEQYGFSQTDCRSDIYSLGVVLCWMLTGETDREKGLCAVKARKLKKILVKCTEFAPERRYSCAEHLKIALSRIDRKRHHIIMEGIGILLLCGFCFGAGFLIGSDTKRASILEVNASVHFDEPLIEEAIRLSLGISKKDKIRKEDLLQVREIYIFGNQPAANSEEYDILVQRWANKDESIQNGGISSLQDIAMLKNLRVLDIILQNITDITPLKELNSLEIIELKHNPLKDVSALQEHPALQRIYLYDTRVSDLSVLSGCPRLDNLVVGMTDVTSLDAFTGLDRLCCLDASGIILDSLSDIDKFPYLKEISFYSVKDMNLNPLLALPKLKKVFLSNRMKEPVDKIAKMACFDIIYIE